MQLALTGQMPHYCYSAHSETVQNKIIVNEGLRQYIAMDIIVYSDSQLTLTQK